MNNLRKQVILEKLAKLTSPIIKTLKEHKLLGAVNKGTVYADDLVATGMSSKDINRTMHHVVGRGARPEFARAGRQEAQVKRLKEMGGESQRRRAYRVADSADQTRRGAELSANIGRMLKKLPGKDKIKTTGDLKRRYHRAQHPGGLNLQIDALKRDRPFFENTPAVEKAIASIRAKGGAK